jgi:hypothetical protein
MIQDQIFQPGDKVMVVLYGPKTIDSFVAVVPKNNTPIKGQVYCVSDFFSAGSQIDKIKCLMNVIRLVGVSNPIEFGVETGWSAVAFRKVEEIKMILEQFGNKEVEVGKFI